MELNESSMAFRKKTLASLRLCVRPKPKPNQTARRMRLRRIADLNVRHIAMSRPIAILLATLLFGLVIAVAATEQNSVSGSVDQHTLVFNVVAQVLLALGLFTYCGFAALHSTQHIASPHERSTWLIATVVLNVLGSCWYYLTIYQSFRKAGQGRLMRFRKARHA
jgi:heme/copper-type cytochrome/quinol oxidase subunit 2